MSSFYYIDKKQKEKDVSDEGLVAADEIDPQRVMAPGGKIDTSFGLEAFHGTATRKEVYDFSFIQ